MTQKDVPGGETIFTNVWRQVSARYSKDIRIDQYFVIFCCCNWLKFNRDKPSKGS